MTDRRGRAQVQVTPGRIDVSRTELDGVENGRVGLVSSFNLVTFDQFGHPAPRIASRHRRKLDISVVIECNRIPVR